MKLQKIKLIDGDRKRYFVASVPDGKRLPRFMEDDEGRTYELFDALNTTETVRYCEITFGKLSDYVDGGAIDVS